MAVFEVKYEGKHAVNEREFTRDFNRKKTSLLVTHKGKPDKRQDLASLLMKREEKMRVCSSRKRNVQRGC